jgi:dipeptidyl aminopeptidase/acylaminoacyl peptidase
VPRFLLLLIFLFCFQGSLQANAESTLKAAFIRGGNLWIKMDNKEIQITQDGKVSGPTWSPDGKWIAYSKQGETTDKSEIWVYHIKSGKTYHVFHDGHNYQWAPDKNILAFQGDSVLNVKDFRDGKPGKFYNVALGVDNYSWLPDGKGFLASASADLRPDGWTNPVLYKISLEEDLKPDDLFKNAQKFFEIPGTLKKDKVGVLSIGTSRFQWSPDKKWISFIVEPTASWSMDSNMLCVLSSDGNMFEPLDEMASGFPFYWAPTSNLLGYIQGGGRIVFGFKNKNLKVKELPAFQPLVLTPKGFVDLSFTWQNDENVIVSRSPEREWSNEPAKRSVPILYRINIQKKYQRQISFPPSGYGDFNPKFLQRNKKLTWTRSNWEKNEVWISEPDGTAAKKWIKNIDDQNSVSWYDPKE